MKREYLLTFEGDISIEKPDISDAIMLVTKVLDGAILMGCFEEYHFGSVQHKGNKEAETQFASPTNTTQAAIALLVEVSRYLLERKVGMCKPECMCIRCRIDLFLEEQRAAMR